MIVKEEKDAIINMLNGLKFNDEDFDDYNLGFNDAIDLVINNLSPLLMTKIEPLTDIEQRIFLAAIGREEKVCKEVDEKYDNTKEPRQLTLVRVCKEIERKVKKALWKN